MLAVCVLATLVVACASPASTSAGPLTTAAPATSASATAISSPAPSAGTVVFCGTFVLENPGAAGTYMLTSPAATRLVVFRTVSSRGLPEFGSYACARFTAGSARQVGGLSLTEFVALLDPGEAGYIAKP